MFTLDRWAMIGTITANSPESLKTLGDRGQWHLLCNYDHVSVPRFRLQSDCCHISFQVFASSWTEAAWGGCCCLWQHSLIHRKKKYPKFISVCILKLQHQGILHALTGHILQHLTIFLLLTLPPTNHSCCFISEAPKLCDKKHRRHSGNKLSGSSLLSLLRLSLLWYSTWKLEGLREREKPEPGHNASLKSSAPSADD